MTKTQTIKKVSNIVVTMAEVGAILIRSLVQGQKMGVAAKVVAIPLAFDFLVRVAVIIKPYFKE